MRVQPWLPDPDAANARTPIAVCFSGCSRCAISTIRSRSRPSCGSRASTPEWTTVLGPSTAAATAPLIEISASMIARTSGPIGTGSHPAVGLREVPGRDDGGSARSRPEGGDGAELGGGHVGVDDVEPRRLPAHRPGDLGGAGGGACAARRSDRAPRAWARSPRRSPRPRARRRACWRASRSTNCSTPEKPSERIAWRMRSRSVIGCPPCRWVTRAF